MDDDPESVSQNDIEALLAEAQASLFDGADDEVDALPAGDAPDGGQAFQLDELDPSSETVEPHSMDMLNDVELNMRIELGRTHMRLEDVLHLRGGSVVALDKLAGDPVDVFINGRLVARGEVLVMNDSFCIRVTELVGVGI